MVARRSGPKLPHPELAHGIPIFLDQIINTLMIGQGPEFSHGTPEPSCDADAAPGVAEMALLHGRDLRNEGFTIEQVIRDYGDVCQAVTKLAAESGAPISAREFHTFNRLLDDAIAAAVTEYSSGKKGAAPIEASLTATDGFERGTDHRDHLETALTQSQRALASTEAALTTAELEAHEARIRAVHDSLTGLPNRELFDDRMAKAISLAIRHRWTLAVMFLDLDQFKNINDAHGHAAGDAVLMEVAKRLLERARDEDTVCRHGGDEFLYLLINPGAKENVERIAASVLGGIAQPLAVGDVKFVVKPSIGIAIYPSDGCGGDELIKNADAAMYRAKRDSRGFVFFGDKDDHSGNTSETNWICEPAKANS